MFERRTLQDAAPPMQWRSAAPEALPGNALPHGFRHRLEWLRTKAVRELNPVPFDSPNSTTPKRTIVRAPRGTQLSCKGWDQESALRMLMNSLEPEVAERPELVGEPSACDATGQPVHDWQAYAAIAEALSSLENNQTLLVQSGKLAGIVSTSAAAPRVLIDAKTTAESWMYAGTQGALEVTCETFRAAAQLHFGGDLAGRLVVSAGMGKLGGAQPLAAQLNGAAFLGIDADPARIKRRVKGGYCDVMVSSLDEALRILKNAVRQRAARSVGLVGNAADVMCELAQRGVVPDLLTDRTAAHDPLCGYWPQGLDLAQADELRRSDPAEARHRSLDSIATQVRAMLELRKLGAILFDFGNQLFVRAGEAGVKGADAVPGFAETYLAPALSENRAPLRWIALSGEPADIDRLDRFALELFPDDERLRIWLPLVQKHVRPQGLPARVCWLPREARTKFSVAVNDLVARNELRAPVVLGRDLLDCGPDAKPAGDCSEPALLESAGGAISPRMQSILDAASGASWATTSGRGAAIVADGTPAAAARIELVMKR
jgi:urocanate hydratase